VKILNRVRVENDFVFLPIRRHEKQIGLCYLGACDDWIEWLRKPATTRKLIGNGPVSRPR